MDESVTGETVDEKEMPDGVDVAVSEAVTVLEAVMLPLAVMLRVTLAVAVLVRVLLGVAVKLRDTLTVADQDRDPVAVPEEETVDVADTCVCEGVAVEVRDAGDLVGVGVGAALHTGWVAMEPPLMRHVA